MSKNILVIVGSPQGKKGNSEAIADSLIERLSYEKLNYSKLYLRKEIGKEGNILIKLIDKADVIIISLPIYENSVPGLVLRFFEEIYKEKDKLVNKPRKLLVITNSGFPEVEANRAALETCRLFARDIKFKWMGGIGVSPGTLIGGKKLEESSRTYKRLITALDLITEAIVTDNNLPEQVLKISGKSFMNPYIYRFGGRIAQNSIIKKIGKYKFLSKPLIN